jgi:predicted small lipoprotein YifL
MSETIKKLIVVAMIAVFAVAALSACGKKGKLENDESEYPRHYPSR